MLRFLLLFLAFGFTGCSGGPRGSVLVQGGTFLQGDPSAAPDALERPVHPVTVGAFWMAETEVTQGVWVSVMHTIRTDTPGEDQPVDQVSFAEACEFCNRLSAGQGLRPAYRIRGQDVEWDRSAAGYRLPAEAEWEFAARGGVRSQGFLFAGGDNPDEVAWSSGNTGASARPVGLKKPNELGLYDMSGNVWEWCWDWFAPYPSTPQTDPAGPAAGMVRQAQGAAPATGPVRVSRGGGWSFDAVHARTTARYFAPDYRGWVNGLRPVRNAAPRRNDP